MQLESLTVDYHRVTGIYAPLVADNDICGFAEQISNFAFSFIAPLGADHNYVSQGFFAFRSS